MVYRDNGFWTTDPSKPTFFLSFSLSLIRKQTGNNKKKSPEWDKTNRKEKKNQGKSTRKTYRHRDTLSQYRNLIKRPTQKPKHINKRLISFKIDQTKIMRTNTLQNHQWVCTERGPALSVACNSPEENKTFLCKRLSIGESLWLGMEICFLYQYWDPIWFESVQTPYKLPVLSSHVHQPCSV